MIRTILLEGDERLSTPSQPVSSVEDVRDLIADMKETLLNAMPDALGLAAVQIGVNLNVLIMRENLASSYTAVIEKPLMAMINPEIKKTYPKVGQYREGCLSIPDKTCLVHRAQEIKVKYTDENGNSNTVRLTGIEAVVFQHEYDHLRGKLMTTTEGHIKSNIKPGFEKPEESSDSEVPVEV